MRTLLLGLALLASTSGWAAPLLPEEPYKTEILTPSEHFAGNVGSRHLRYDEVSHYFQRLAEQSERMTLLPIGTSYEGRSQIAAVFARPDRLADLDAIIAQRQAAARGEAVDGPLVIWLAYSIHGDEASGLHSGSLFAYYLAASQSEEVAQWLDEAIIVVTPSQNPDGNDRFANWANGYRGAVPNGSSWHREHFQGWPSGRVNHYWADLNRDWLYLAHPESRGRVAFFQQWLPHVVSDYHEMGHQSSYFFQPGVPERTHPLTPQENQDITARIARHHAKALDALYQPYFSKESFDDFYYGKGSTYPDINGAVGILFEQASARGLHRDTQRGELTLSAGVRNHLATSFSTVRGALAESDALKNYQQRFFREGLAKGEDRRDSGLLVSARGDANRLQAFATILDSHRIQHAWLSEGTSGDDKAFARGDLYIPFAQHQYPLVEALFDQRTSFRDNTFYDVSAFSAELAFNLTVAETRRAPPTQASKPVATAADYQQSALQWLLPWGDRQAPAALNQLLNEGFRVRFAEVPGTVQGRGGEVSYQPGALLLKGDQPGLGKALTKVSADYGLKAQPLVSGLAIEGPDLGSRRFHAVEAVKPAILIGRDVSQYEAGMLWYYLDQVLGVDTTLVDGEYFSRFPLKDFTHLFLVDGRYGRIGKGAGDKIERFVKDGGTLVAWKRGVAQLAKWNLTDITVNQRQFFEPDFVHAGDALAAFAHRGKENARKTIGGAIVAWELDTTHPLGFGLTARLPLMKDHELSLVPAEDAGRTLARYGSELLLSGYMAEEYQALLAQEVSAQIEYSGQGRYLMLADNPLFRNFWLGTEHLVANALFLLPALD